MICHTYSRTQAINTDVHSEVAHDSLAAVSVVDGVAGSVGGGKGAEGAADETSQALLVSSQRWSALIRAAHGHGNRAPATSPRV